VWFGWDTLTLICSLIFALFFVSVIVIEIFEKLPAFGSVPLSDWLAAGGIVIFIGLLVTSALMDWTNFFWVCMVIWFILSFFGYLGGILESFSHNPFNLAFSAAIVLFVIAGLPYLIFHSARYFDFGSFWGGYFVVLTLFVLKTRGRGDPVRS